MKPDGGVAGSTRRGNCGSRYRSAGIPPKGSKRPSYGTIDAGGALQDEVAGPHARRVMEGHLQLDPANQVEPKTHRQENERQG